MKQKTTFLTTCFLTLLTITFGFSQNLIINGDFEANNTNDGWLNSTAGPAYSFNTNTVMSGATFGTFGYTLEAAHGGTYAARLKTGGSALRQVVSVSEGTYVVQFWFVGTLLNVDIPVVITDWTGDVDNGNLVLTPIVTDSGTNATTNTEYGCLVTDNSGSASSWKEAKFSFNIPSGSSINQVRFTFFVPQNNELLFLDDVSIVQDNSLSVNDLVKFDFKSFPNPAKDFINLSASKNIDKVEIYSITGQQLINKNISTNRTQLDVSNLSRGVYILRAFIEDAVGSYKFIKD